MLRSDSAFGAARLHDCIGIEGVSLSHEPRRHVPWILRMSLAFG
jgi:hypothetical protein